MSWAWNPTRDPQARLICGMGMRNNKRGRRKEKKREEKRRKEKKREREKDEERGRVPVKGPGKGRGFPLKVQVKTGGAPVNVWLTVRGRPR